MKYIASILLVLMTFTAKCQPAEYDTVRCVLPVLDTTTWYKIYRSNGKLYKTVTSYQPIDIPVGGWVSEEEFVNPQQMQIKGHYVLETKYPLTDSAYSTVVKFLNGKKAEIPPPYIIIGWYIPVSGLQFVQLQ